jgi:hypothetical protein
MRFNDGDLAHFAASPNFIDKAGWLWKRGADASPVSSSATAPPVDAAPSIPLHQYKKRWFVLKGNLLFYFKQQVRFESIYIN